MTQKLTPEHERSASLMSSNPLVGEVVGLEGARVRVRLETGIIGFVTRTPDKESHSSLQLGQQGKFEVIESDADGETNLSLLSLQESSGPLSFEHDVNRLNSALTQHHVAPIERDEIVPTLDEQRIQLWLNRVDKSLDKLRRSRAKRLDEEFYSGS